MEMTFSCGEAYPLVDNRHEIQHRHASYMIHFITIMINRLLGPMLHMYIVQPKLLTITLYTNMYVFNMNQTNTCNLLVYKMG